MKKITIKIILTIVSLGIILLITFKDKFKKIEDEVGTIIIVQTNENELKREEISCSSKESIYTIINRSYEISLTGSFLNKIDLLSDDKNHYIAIYINNEYSGYGVKGLVIGNNVFFNDVIEFRMTAL